MAKIYCSTSGNDSTGDGSLGNPYATPDKCFTEATAGTVTFDSGDTIVIIGPGTFVGNTGAAFKRGLTLLGRDSSGVEADQAGFNLADRPIIQADASGDVLVMDDHSTIRGIEIDGASTGTVGIDPGGETRVYDCKIHDCVGIGFGGSTVSGEVTVVRVESYANGSTGINTANTSSARIESCLCYDNNGTGINAAGSSGVVIEHCTVANGTSAGADAGIWAPSATIRNCIAFDNKGFYGLAAASGTYDNNCAFTSDGGQFHTIGNFNGTKDGDSIESDPLFVDEANDDYRLTDSSPCKGTGATAATTTTDIEGNAFSDPPNMGAFRSFDALAQRMQLEADDGAVVKLASSGALQLSYDS